MNCPDKLKVLHPNFYLKSDYRASWTQSQIRQSLDKGRISTEVATKLTDQVADPKNNSHLVDIVMTNIPPFLISAASVPLAAYIGFHQDSYELLALAALQHMPLIPKLSLGGVFRAGWLTQRVIRDRISAEPSPNQLSLRAEIANVLVSASSPFGHFSAPIRMAGNAPELAAFFAHNTIEDIGDVLDKMPIVKRGSQRFKDTASSMYGKLAKFDLADLKTSTAISPTYARELIHSFNLANSKTSTQPPSTYAQGQSRP